MSNWELIDFCPQTGLKKYLGDNPDDPDGVLVRYEQTAQSIQTILDRNRREEVDNQNSRMGDMEKVASIPVGVMYEWKRKYNVDAWAASYNPEQAARVKRLLNDPEWRYLKCRNIIL